MTVQISYAGAVIYTGVLKAIGYSMTKLVCTLYNSVYELLQRRDYVGKWTSTAANVILSDITGSGGVGSDSFGNTTAESGEDYTNYGHKEGPRYQMIAISGATITSIKAYVKVDSASNAKIAVYSDSSGSPSALLGVSNEVNVTNTTYAWITFTFGTPVAVTASAYYWFIIMTDNAVYWATNWSGSTPHKVGNEVYSDGFSDPFGSITNSYTSHDSFYAVLSIGTPGGGECPTTVVSVDYDAVAFDCAVNLAKILSKNYWGDTIGNFNIGVRNSCKLAFTFDENNGTIVNDLSGFANHGTIYPTPSSFTFGRTDTGNTTQGYSANQKAANIFTAGATGQLSKITVRLKRNTTSGKARAALYANSSGAPGALIAQTQEVTVTTTTGWFDFPFLLGAYPSVVNGTAYWLAILTDEAYTLRVNNTTGTINYNADTYSDGFANPFGTPSTTASRQICIYATGATPSPTWITGKYGGALSLLGSSSYYVSVPAASSLSITGDVTVALWIRRTGTDTGYPQLASKVSNTGQIAWGIHAVTGTYHPYMVARIGNVEYNTVSPNALPLNVWTFVVGVRRGTTLEIWENAVLVNSNVAIPASAMDANNTGAFRINFDAGSIAADHDELLVINRALAAEEILFMTNFVQHGCRRGIDRSKRRDYIRVKGVDAYGNRIEGTAGSGSNVTVVTKTQPADQATLTLLAVQKLAELNTDNTGTPIILPISVGAYLKPGDSIPLHIPELAMDSIYQVKRLTKGSSRVRMEVEASTVIYESTLEQLKESSLEQLSLRTGVKFTRSLSSAPPANPDGGDMWYQTDTFLYFWWDGSVWQQFQPVV